MWSVSNTALRPLRRSSIFWSTTLAIKPIKLPAKKMPSSVTIRPKIRAGQPASPTKDPASSTRSKLCQNASKGLSDLSTPPIPVMRMTTEMIMPTTMIRTVSRPR